MLTQEQRAALEWAIDLCEHYSAGEGAQQAIAALTPIAEARKV